MCNFAADDPSQTTNPPRITHLIIIIQRNAPSSSFSSPSLLPYAQQNSFIYDGDERASNGVGGWKNIGGNTLNAFQGYIFQTNKSGEIELTITDPVFTGADKHINFEGHASSNVQDAGWNFVGNPNLSYYDLSCFIADVNMDGIVDQRDVEAAVRLVFGHTVE